MDKKRMLAAILAASVMGLCACAAEKDSETERTHSASTYPPEEAIVFDTEATEADARVIAEQLCGMEGEYELRCDGEGYAQGGEAMIYTAVSGDTSYRMAVSYIGGKYVYSDEADDFIIDFQWLCEKYGIDRDAIEEAVSSYWTSENPDSDNRIAATGTVLYDIAEAGGPAFEVWVMNDDEDEAEQRFAVAADTMTIFAEGDSGYAACE